MDENVKWVVGFLTTLIIIVAGYARHVATMIKAGDDALHERINRTRDEYVRRIDLDAHMARMERQIHDLRDDVKSGQKATNDRLDQVLTKLGHH